MLKKIIVVSIVGCLALLCAACSDDAEDACEHINEICASQAGFQKQDCAKSKEAYDKATDAEKEKADKAIECIMDLETCDLAALSACSK